MAVTYGLSEAIASGLSGYFQGHDRRRREEEYDRRQTVEEGRLKREEEGYEYEKSQRPLIERQRGLTVRQGEHALDQSMEESEYNKSRRPVTERKDEAVASKAETDAEEARRLADQEGIVTAVKYLKAGMPEKAKQYYNQHGTGRVDSLYLDPDDPSKKRWIAKGVDGAIYNLDPDAMLHQLRVDKDKTQSGNVEYLQFVADQVYNGDFKAAFDAISSAKSKDPITYARELYAKLRASDPSLSDEDITAAVNAAMNYTLPEAGGVAKPALPPQPSQSEMEQAEKEIRHEMGAKDWIPFVEPDPAKIRERAVANRGDATKQSAPEQSEAPPAAVEYLRKNPQLKDAFRNKYGYLPEGL